LDALTHIDLNTLGSFNLSPGGLKERTNKRDALISPDMRRNKADAGLLSLTLEPTHHHELLTKAPAERL